MGDKIRKGINHAPESLHFPPYENLPTADSRSRAIADQIEEHEKTVADNCSPKIKRLSHGFELKWVIKGRHGGQTLLAE